MKLRELAERIGVELIGDGDVEISGAAGVSEAGEGQITYVEERRIADLEHTRASAAVVPHTVAKADIPILRARNPRFAFGLALSILYERPYEPAGVSSKASIGKDVVIGSEPSIYPNVVIDDGARIGDRVTLYPGVYVGKGSVIGDDSVLHPNVCIGEGVSIGRHVIIHAGAVIGSDGFGFVTEGGVHHKIPQVGGVIIEDYVEIGANSTVDRAALGNTVIKQGTKLDNLVHVAHNVAIGSHCLIAAQVGIAGSSALGDYVVLGGQVGIADHIVIGDRVMVGGKSGITRDVEAGQVIAGHYAMRLREWLKVQAVLPRLPELNRIVAELDKYVKQSRGKGEGS